MNQIDLIPPKKQKSSDFLIKFRFNLQEIEFIKKRFDKIAQNGILTESLFRKSMGILGLDHISFISDRIF